jgi:hypothetical protein
MRIAVNAWGTVAFRALLVALLGCLVASPYLRGAEEVNRDDRLALFRDRNVFDPNRSAPRRGEVRRESAAPPPTESFRLVGALIHDDKAFGFFDGSASDYRRVVALGEVIAGFKVVAIDTAAATLERDTQSLVLAVGAGMSRTGEAAWAATDTPQVANRAEREEAREADGEAKASTAPAAGDKEGNDDLLRRMLERRRQEQSR